MDSISFLMSSKGLSMLANYFLNPHAGLLLALGVIQITCGIAMQLGVLLLEFL